MNDVLLLLHTKKVLDQAEDLRISLEGLLNDLTQYERGLLQQLETRSAPAEHHEPAATTANHHAETTAVPEAVQDQRIERRAGARRKCMPVALLLSFSRKGKDPFPGWAIESDEFGLGMLTNSEMVPGTHLVARPKNAPARCPWVKMEVKHCHKDQDRWFVGCAFANRLSIEDLDLFRH